MVQTRLRKWVSISSFEYPTVLVCSVHNNMPLCYITEGKLVLPISNNNNVMFVGSRLPT